MWSSRYVLILTLLCVWPAAPAGGEVLIRWDRDRVPSPESLGIRTLVVPVTNTSAVQDALQKGYRVLVEADRSTAATLKLPPSVDGLVLKGAIPAAELEAVRRRLSPSARVFSTNDAGAWPHVRLNWVTLRNDVLQVSSRTAQPWVEHNGTRILLDRLQHPGTPRLLTYAWEPITVSDMHQGPALENYLVAIAEAGTFGADLLLPLHERFQRSLLLGHPVARAEWQQIRRALDFYSWDLAPWRQMSNVGVVTADPKGSFVILNLLARHNMPFELIKPSELATRKPGSLRMLVIVGEPDAGQVKAIERFAGDGGTVVLAGAKGAFPWQSAPPSAKTDEQMTYRVGTGLVIHRPDWEADPNAFILDLRPTLARRDRVLEIWNGITVLARPYEDPETGTLMITLLNYAHEAAPIQVRVRGTFSAVHYETPDAPAVLIPYRQSDGQTEFVVPDLRVGGRIFLTPADDSSN